MTDYDPFDLTPGTIPPGVVVDYDAFDDDESAPAIVDFTYYDSEEFLLSDDAAHGSFGALVERTYQDAPSITSRSQAAEILYQECPALVDQDVNNLSDTVLSEIQKISDKIVRLSVQEYNQDQKIAAVARREMRENLREEMLATGRDLVDIVHEQGAALHDFDKTARALGYGWDWSSDKNRVARQARGRVQQPAAFMTRGQAAVVGDGALSSDIVKSVQVKPTESRPVVRNAAKVAKSAFAKLVTIKNAGRVIPDKSTFPDRKIIINDMPARGDYRKPPAAKNDAPGMDEMFKNWMKSRGKVSYHGGKTATKLPGF